MNNRMEGLEKNQKIYKIITRDAKEFIVLAENYADAILDLRKYLENEERMYSWEKEISIIKLLYEPTAKNKKIFIEI